jgi:hypothetical protein
VTYGRDSGNRIFVLYWRCSLIRVPVIRGSTVHVTYIRRLRNTIMKFIKLYFCIKF